MKTQATLPDMKVFSVSEYIQFLNIFFEKHEHRVLGEICEFKKGPTGHLYFTLKDKNGSAVLDCKMWKSVYDLCGVNLAEGLEIIITGHVNIWEKNGRLSMIARSVELVGEGALKKQYDELKKKLEAEGVFAPARKRKIPEFAHRIGVITSRNGAVIHDFLNNLGRFGFDVRMVDSRVEGQIAAKDVLDGVRTMRKQDIDVLVVIRGGGSLESLQAFNNEALVREIVDFPVPVIAGIGHDQDVPLLALAADHMTSTPTAAAHVLNRSWEEAYAKIHQVASLTGRIGREFPRIRADLDASWASLLDHTESRLETIGERLKSAEQAIRLNDPARQLKLGYAIVRSGGKILKSVKDAKKGGEMSTELADGKITSTITNYG
jgi:exodeoxyribonuclease VII large subunit